MTQFISLAAFNSLWFIFFVKKKERKKERKKEKEKERKEKKRKERKEKKEKKKIPNFLLYITLWPH